MTKKDLSISPSYAKIVLLPHPVAARQRESRQMPQTCAAEYGGTNMFRLWAREFQNNRMLRDTVIADDSQDTRTHKVFRALDQVCYEFDLGKPIWLDSTVAEFKRHSKARFRQDNFIEEIPFDYLEIQVIDED